MCVFPFLLGKKTQDESELPKLGRSHPFMCAHTHFLGPHPAICCDLAFKAENSTGWPLVSPSEPISAL